MVENGYGLDYSDDYMVQEEEWEREGLLDPAWEKQQKKVSDFSPVLQSENCPWKIEKKKSMRCVVKMNCDSYRPMCKMMRRFFFLLPYQRQANIVNLLTEKCKKNGIENSRKWNE